MSTVQAATVPLRAERLTVVLAGLVTVCVWASAFVGIRFAGRDLSPGALALGRLVVGSLSLGALMLARRERLPERRAIGGTVLCGVLWFGVYNVALNAAERRVDAGTAALLVNTARSSSRSSPAWCSGRDSRGCCSRAASSRSPARR
jgi:drug/metabolite transporter (DMT)-like permease